jgi:hypothetical protein
VVSYSQVNRRLRRVHVAIYSHHNSCRQGKGDENRHNKRRVEALNALLICHKILPSRYPVNQVALPFVGGLDGNMLSFNWMGLP